MYRFFVGLSTKVGLFLFGISFTALGGGTIGIALAFLFEFSPPREESAHTYSSREPASAPTRLANIPAKLSGVAESELAKLSDGVPDDTFGAMPRKAREFKVAVAPPIPSSCKVASYKSDVAVIGDRVRLSFFETVDLTQSSSAHLDVPNKIAHERLDLSGTFPVDQDGTISTPLIGRVEVLGRSIGCFEPILARAAFEAGIPNLTVSAAFAHRPFVIAQGDLRSPGQYDFAPGMTVRHLVTIAGAPALDKEPLTAEERNRLLERGKELERALMGTLVKHSRILAALDSQKGLQLDPKLELSVKQLLGEALIDAEEKVLKADIDLWRATTAQHRIDIRSLESLVAQKQKQIVIIDDFLTRTKARYKDLETHLERGIIKESSLIEVGAEILELEKSLIDAQSDLIELKSHETKMTAAFEKETLEYQKSLTRELQQVSELVAGYENQITTVNAMLSADEKPSQLLLTLSISRAAKDRRIRFKADWDTPIWPGDVLSAELVASESGSDWARGNSEPLGELRIVESEK